MEFQSNVAGAATAFAEISSRAAASSNIERLRIAEGNIRAAENQIRLEESAARSNISRSLAQYQGSQAAARAFRGGGTAGTGFAVSDAATAQAADQVAIVESNAAAKEVAAAAANQVQLEDPVLAAIQGGIEGINFGTQIARALLEEGEVVQRQSSRQLGGGGAAGDPTFPVFENTISSILEIPGLDFGEFFDFDELFD